MYKHNVQKTPRNNRGFTLVEMLIAIVIMAILVAIAAPSYRTIIERQRISAATTDLVTAINLARSEAVTRMQNVSLAAKNTTDWNGGWNVNDAADNLIHDFPAPETDVTITISSTTDMNVVFSAQGIMSVTSGASPISFTICLDNTGETGRQIQINRVSYVTNTTITCNPLPT